MATIVVQTEINATVEKVWEVISDIDNEPKFWKRHEGGKNIINRRRTSSKEKLQLHLETKNVYKKFN
jgi:Polyketide cyclase / dehydrase and lipid transport.